MLMFRRLTTHKEPRYTMLVRIKWFYWNSQTHYWKPHYVRPERKRSNGYREQTISLWRWVEHSMATHTTMRNIWKALEWLTTKVLHLCKKDFSTRIVSQTLWLLSLVLFLLYHYYTQTHWHYDYINQESLVPFNDHQAPVHSSHSSLILH